MEEKRRRRETREKEWRGSAVRWRERPQPGRGAVGTSGPLIIVTGDHFLLLAASHHEKLSGLPPNPSHSELQDAGSALLCFLLRQSTRDWEVKFIDSLHLCFWKRLSLRTQPWCLKRHLLRPCKNDMGQATVPKTGRAEKETEHAHRGPTPMMMTSISSQSPKVRP